MGIAMEISMAIGDLWENKNTESLVRRPVE
jgi:hypothetical protein